MLTALETGATTRIEHPNGIFSSPQPLPRGLNGWEPDMLFELDIPVGFVPRIVENNEIDPDPFSDPKIATAVDVRYLLGQYPSPEALPTHPDFLTEPRIAQFPLTTTKNGETFDLEPYDLTPDPLSQRYFDQQATLAGILSDVARMSPATDPNHLGSDVVYLAGEIGAMAIQTDETLTTRMYIQRAGRAVPMRGDNDGYHTGRSSRYKDENRDDRQNALVQARDLAKLGRDEITDWIEGLNNDDDNEPYVFTDDEGYEGDWQDFATSLVLRNTASEQKMHEINLPHGRNNFARMKPKVREIVRALAFEDIPGGDTSPQFEEHAPDGADTSDIYHL